ncbi:MAG TPA: hypothetical protein VLD67_13350 [Vicinamibacterales bacterium]|nr:hypothetical protein [Vicinamibacterales bacterium]
MVRVAPFIACLLLAPTLGATVLVPAPFDEVVAGSEIIAHVRVVDVRPEWADGRKRIDSVVTVQVLSYLKGGTRPTLAFKVPGGQIGRYRSLMVGAPAFQRGEEVVLFLVAQGTAMPYVFGLNQGVFRVRQDPASLRRVVVPPPRVASGAGPASVRRGSPARRPIALEAFGAEVRAVMAAKRGAVR